MKRVFAFLPIIFALAANASVVSQNGDWSSTATWSDGVVPAGSSGTPLDSLTFTTTGLTLNVDADHYIKTITTSNIAEQTVNIASGKTITFVGGARPDTSTPGNVLVGDTTYNRILNFTGDGKIQFKLNQDDRITNGIFNFNAEVTGGSGATMHFYNGATINVNKTWASTNNIQFSGWAKLNINADMSVSSFNGWHSGAKLTVAAGKTFASNNYIGFTNGDISGKVWAKGDHSTERYALSLGRAPDGSTINIYIRSGAEVLADSTNQYLQMRGANLFIYSGEKSIVSKKGILLTQANVTLNTTGALSVGTSLQKDSTITVGRIQKETTITKESTAKITLNADNDFGAFEFMGTGSALTFVTNGKKMTIGSFKLGEDATSGSDFTVKLDDLTDFTVYINSLENVVYDTTSMLASNIQFLKDSSYTGAYLVKDNTNGGWWINTSAVPEPASYAAVFGALALAFIMARRRK